MFQRHIEQTLRLEATRMPIVTVMGPRQSGKTTLVRSVFGETHRYVSLEPPHVRIEAQEDPQSFLSRLSEGVILDEVQRAPDLLSYIQGMVDEDDRPGRFILTGSHNLLLMSQVSQTLAGRTAILHLLPLSVQELAGRKALDPERLDQSDPSGDAPSLSIWETVWRGLYPRIHDQNLDPTAWLGDYFRTYIERDLREVARVVNLDAFERLAQLLAARTGHELNYASLAADSGVSQPTAKSWVTALRTSFIVALIPPFHENYRKRVRRRPKIHFLDTGLACYLLAIRDPEALARHPLRGHIFESFIAGELIKSYHNRHMDPRLYHWRDVAGHEIDLLIDTGTRQIPIEVKSGTTIGSDFFKALKWWEALPGNSNKGGVLVYGGVEQSERSGFAVRPWFLS